MSGGRLAEVDPIVRERPELGRQPQDPAIAWRALPTVEFGDAAGIRTAIRNQSPIIITGFAADWPAVTRWTLEHLSQRYGTRRVKVYDASFGEPGRQYMSSIAELSFAEFLHETQIRRRDLRMFLYNLSRQIPELLDDIRLPDLGLRFSRRFVFSFFGCQGSTTPLHYDIDLGDVFHTVIRGRRRIRLFAPQDSVALHRHPFTVRSYVDLDAPDFARFPGVAAATGFEVVLEPQQTLYMPGGWWHEFHYLDAGIGVSLRAAPTRLKDRMRGVGNLLMSMPVDRLGNWVAPQAWHAWKRRAADRAARNYLNTNPSQAVTRGSSA
ncbi:MAG: cupin-like domain-containing protein [Pseudomonadota bacterium]